MKTTLEYLEEAKAALGIKSDYALAKYLKVHPTTISQYKLGKRVIDDLAAAKIADALGIPAITVIAAANMEREKDAEKREYWENFYKRLGGIAAGVLAVLALSDAGFSAADDLPLLLGIVSDVYYVKY